MHGGAITDADIVRAARAARGAGAARAAAARGARGARAHRGRTPPRRRRAQDLLLQDGELLCNKDLIAMLLDESVVMAAAPASPRLVRMGPRPCVSSPRKRALVHDDDHAADVEALAVHVGRPLRKAHLEAIVKMNECRALLDARD